MKEEIIKYLEERIEIEKRYCSKWKDSGDLGACYANEVEPVEKMVEFLKENLNE